MNFEDVVFLITGASSGLGKTLAEILASYNAKVIGIYSKTKVKSSGIEYLACDVTKEKEVAKTMGYINDKYGKLDVLVNCAALSMDNDIYDKDSKSFLEVLNVNLVGPFLMTKYASKIMTRGVVINVSSTDASDTYNPLSMDYCASKAGLENLTKNLAIRFPKLKVCAIAPAGINTDAILKMDPKFLQEQMKITNQKELLRKEDVALKIIEMIINNDNYISGDIVRMDENYE